MIICPKCGAKSTEKEFIESFCIDCYPINVVCPTKMEFNACKRCGDIVFRGEWRRVSEAELSNYIVGKCKGDFAGGEYNKEEGAVILYVKKGGKTIKLKHHIDVKFNMGTCSNCGKISGGYFEAIIQLRGSPLRIKRYEKTLIDALSKKTFVSKVDEKKEGIDLYVGDSKAVLALFNEMGLKLKMSKKLFGQKEGKRIYRTTFAVRL